MSLDNIEVNKFFLISVDLKEGIITVKYIDITNKQENFFLGASAHEMCQEIINTYESEINNFHAAYLGRELLKAEISLLLGQVYIQS